MTNSTSTPLPSISFQCNGSLLLQDGYTAEPETVSEFEQTPANLHKKLHKQQTTVAHLRKTNPSFRSLFDARR
jgi:hypothetical protein